MPKIFKEVNPDQYNDIQPSVLEIIPKKQISLTSRTNVIKEIMHLNICI